MLLVLLGLTDIRHGLHTGCADRRTQCCCRYWHSRSCLHQCKHEIDDFPCAHLWEKCFPVDELCTGLRHFSVAALNSGHPPGHMSALPVQLEN